MAAIPAIDDRLSLVRRGVDGPYSVAGTTSNTGTPNTPVRRRVRLHRQTDGQLLAEMWSNAVSGAYSFDNIAAGTYYVAAFDHTGTYGAEAESDIVVPEPVP